MKTMGKIIILFCLLSTQFIYSQDEIAKTWEGTLNISGQTLRVIFHITLDENGKLMATLDSPDQGVRGIPVAEVRFNNSEIKMEVPAVGGGYEGIVNDDFTRIKGEWKQMGNSMPLALTPADKDETRSEPPPPALNRPQEPKEPYPYNEEEIAFENSEAGITLAGTLTYPEEGLNFPAVVLVTGSGPHNRNEELFGHKPFLVWADHLTRNGFAVLRFDDRGFGKSTGTFNGAITPDFASDAVAAINYLKNRKEVNPEKIGIIGHSEGGLVAPMAANKSDDIAFIVLAAGPALPGKEILLLQSELISRAEGIDEKRIDKTKEVLQKIYNVIFTVEDSTEAVKQINEIGTEYLNSLPDDEKQKPENAPEVFEYQKNIIMSPWYRYFLKYDPRPELEKLDIPVLALFGEKDLQVPAVQNKEEMEKALEKSNSNNYQVIVFPGLNHLFQESKTGALSEYGKIEQTVSPKMLETVAEWIKKVGNN